MQSYMLVIEQKCYFLLKMLLLLTVQELSCPIILLEEGALLALLDLTENLKKYEKKTSPEEKLWLTKNAGNNTC